MTGKSGIAGRRTALKLLSAAPLLTLPSWVSADAPDFPSREVRFVCAFPPGAGADVWVSLLRRDGALVHSETGIG